MTNRQKIIYIAGHGRSGSTILERILGQLDDVVAVGELRHIWQRGFAENQLCGCGKSFEACEFWSQVTAYAFADQPFTLAETQALRHRVDRMRYVPYMLSPKKPAGYAHDFATYTTIRQRLYDGIAQVSGKSLIIDSSKDISSLFLLAKMPAVDLRVVHLVRDSRAVAFSWQRKKIRPEITTQTAYMPTFNPTRISAEWTYRNIFAEIGGRMANGYVRIRYEDFVRDPLTTVQAILRCADYPVPALDFINGTTVDLQKSNHTVSGNPVRFMAGTTELKLDSEWENAMSRRQKWLVGAIALPMLLKYRYPLNR